MKILVISNYYPPHYVGGYELGCRTVVEQLAARGHTLRVLTGTYRLDTEYAGPEDGSGSGIPSVRVDRILHLESGPGGSPSAGKFHMIKQCGIFRRVVEEFQPDIIYFWNLSGLCLWLPTCALLMGKKCAFFISDSSFVAWRIAAVLFRFVRDTPRTRAGALLQRLIRAVFGETWLVRGYPVLFQRPCHFASAFLQNLAQREDIDFHGQNSDVIHWGIDVARFTPPAPSQRWPARKLLYVGQVIPQKGVHTAVEAMVLLAKTPGFEDMTLSIAGGSSNPEYEQQLRSLPLNLGVVDRVEFLGKVPGDELAAVYHAHDVLVFPSTWDEPFAITPLEAMAAELPVVGTLTGGSGEIFRTRETAMTFEAGDAISCATAVVELCSSRSLFDSIRAEAYERVASRHTLGGMVDRIEEDLKSIANSGDPA